MGAEVGGGAKAASGFVVGVPGAGGRADPAAFVEAGSTVVDAADPGG
jgi:hypothetical protein